MHTICLRIKKKYLEQIKSGEKKFEYRNLTEKYKKQFKNKKSGILKLHYQKEEKLYVEYSNITIVKNTLNIPELTTDKVFKIHLTKPLNI